PSADIDPGQAEEILGSFFEADWHNQISPHPRYAELFERRKDGRPFGEQDLRDLRMWFNLAWFASEFREGPVELVTGDRVTVHRFVEKGHGFTEADIQEMVEDQRRIMRAVVPIHRSLQEAGRIEVVTTPYFHPILPLLIDTDQATMDRPGARLPRRFSHPEDAREQVQRAIRDYEGRFGRKPDGMWPAEAAVSQETMRILGEAGVRWAVTDQGILARSGRWGYDVDDPGIALRPYRFPTDGSDMAIFFRDGKLSDRIAFQYGEGWQVEEAARDFVNRIKARAGDGGTGSGKSGAGPGDREALIVTVALDGENSWGGYADDGRPFLHALYRALESDPGIRTLTFGEFLDGSEPDGISAHPPGSLERVYELFTGSWVDEPGSDPGVDLGTWIGEEEENRAWDLLGRAREEVEARGGMEAVDASAAHALLAAEGSDWFWWFGQDQESKADSEFDELFRIHLHAVYVGLGLDPPDALRRYIVKQAVVWTFAAPVERVEEGDSLVVRTNCPGVLHWWRDGGDRRSVELKPGGGPGAGARRFQTTLGPLDEAGRDVHFRFECHHPRCRGRGPFCSPEERAVEVGSSVGIDAPAGSQGGDGDPQEGDAEGSGKK
ncbi:MAG: glycoside hydrolase family 57 protein, partial [Longimicrobiales bacterium]|nr:glycoside hydrolase family 57 protein [Longimicrobiales bacterium]